MFSGILKLSFIIILLALSKEGGGSPPIEDLKRSTELRDVFCHIAPYCFRDAIKLNWEFFEFCTGYTQKEIDHKGFAYPPSYSRVPNLDNRQIVIKPNCKFDEVPSYIL